MYAERAVLSPVRLSVFCKYVCLSHGWISQKQLKLGLCNSHPIPLAFAEKFHPELLASSLNGGTGGVKQGCGGKTSFLRQYLENGKRYVYGYY